MLKKTITLGIMLIFIGSIGCTVTYKGYSEQYLSNDEYSQQYSVKGVDNIVISSQDWVNIDIEVVSTDADTIQVDAKYADNIINVTSNSNSDAVFINIESLRDTNMGMFHRGTNNTMVVGIPEKYKGDITVSGGLNVTMRYLNVNSVQLVGKKMPVVSIENCNIKNEIKSTTNVNLNMENSTAEDIDVVGWGSFFEVSADNLSVNGSGNGQIELTSVDIKKDIYLDAGEVSLTDVNADGLKLYSQYGRKSLTNIQIDNDIMIKNGNGEVTFSDVTAKNVEVDNKNGTVTIEDLTTGQLDIDARNGDVNILQSQTGISEVRSEYGIIQIDDLIGNLTITNKNGNITVERGEGDINIYNKYGNVEINRSEINNNITVNNKNGDVDMYVNANKANNVGFDINVTNGSISDEDEVNSLSKVGNYKVEVNIGYGNFSID